MLIPLTKLLRMQKNAKRCKEIAFKQKQYENAEYWQGHIDALQMVINYEHKLSPE